MKKIFKYTLQVVDEQSVIMPIGAEILSVGLQRGEIVVYALVVPVDENACQQSRRFSVRGTGHEAGNLDNYNFLGTVIDDTTRNLVWHIFIEKQPR